MARNRYLAGSTMDGRVGALAQTPPSSEQPRPPAAEQAPPLSAEQDPPPSAEQIAAWIKELDSSRYLSREQATQHLIAAGLPAVPALLSAANSKRLEPADRAVWILRKMADSEETALRRTAVEHLVRVEGRPRVVAEALDVLADLAHEEAVLAIEQLGGRLLEEGIDPTWRQRMPRRVILDSKWRGSDQGLEHLTKLRDVPLVIIVGTHVTRPGVARLAKLESLEALRLYATPLVEPDVAALEKLMPGVTIDFRRGALLGVTGRGLQGAAEVETVQPESAAAAAGIRSRDIIMKYDGKPVADFDDLTRKIAKNLPGDEVKLHILRNGEPLEVRVTLGQWKVR